MFYSGGVLDDASVAAMHGKDASGKDYTCSSKCGGSWDHAVVIVGFGTDINPQT